MSPTTVLGIVAGTAILVLSIIAGAQGATSFFINKSGLAIVLGGTIAATCISFPLKEVIRIFSVLKIVFSKEDIHPERYVLQISSLAAVARKGIAALEKELENIDHPFLRDGVQMIVDGLSAEEIRDIMETRNENRILREQAEARVFRAMARFSPAFGMLGTLIGLIGMLANMGGGAMHRLGPSMAVALVTTFYGLLLANLVFNPMAEKMERRTEDEISLRTLIIEGILMLHDRKHPYLVEEKLNSFLPPRRWVSSREVGAESAAGAHRAT